MLVFGGAEVHLLGYEKHEKSQLGMIGLVPVVKCSSTCCIDSKVAHNSFYTYSSP